MTIDSDQYASKKMTYFSAPQTDMGTFLPPRAERMLEIGCGTGATSAWFQQHGRVGHTIGIDLFHSAVDVAQSCLDEAYVGNIETMPLPIKPASKPTLLTYKFSGAMILTGCSTKKSSLQPTVVRLTRAMIDKNLTIFFIFR